MESETIVLSGTAVADEVAAGVNNIRIFGGSSFTAVQTMFPWLQIDMGSSQLVKGLEISSEPPGGPGKGLGSA